MPDPSVAAVITVNDMYHELQGVRADVQTLVGKFDNIPAQITELQSAVKLVAGVPDEIRDHETRLRLIEQTKSGVTWPALGAVLTLMCVALGVIATFLVVTHAH